MNALETQVGEAPPIANSEQMVRLHRTLVRDFIERSKVEYCKGTDPQWVELFCENRNITVEKLLDLLMLRYMNLCRVTRELMIGNTVSMHDTQRATTIALAVLRHEESRQHTHFQ